jgi:hypothetical protein
MRKASAGESNKSKHYSIPWGCAAADAAYTPPEFHAEEKLFTYLAEASVLLRKF